jgi:hypothetical protein
MNRETFAIKLEGPKSKTEQIEQALRDVQAQMPESEGALPFTDCIPSAAREIYLSWRRHEAPSRKPSQWHKQFQTNVEGILKLLREMPAELVEDVFQNFEQKSQLHQRLVWALANSKLNPPHKAGRRAKLETRRLAIMVATFYYSLTGRPLMNPLIFARL